MHAFFSFLFVGIQKEKEIPNSIFERTKSIIWHHSVRYMQRLMETTKPQKENKKHRRRNDGKHSATVTFMLTNGQCVVCNTQSKCMPCKVNEGTTGWAKEHQASQTGEGPHYWTQPDAKGSKWCSYKGGSNRIGQETSEIKRAKTNEWTKNPKRIWKVSRRVPTAISPFFFFFFW